MKPLKPNRTDRQVKRILDALTGRPMTTVELAAHLNLSVSGVLYCMRPMREVPRQIHVADHITPAHGRGRPAPVYAVGDLPDVEFVAAPKVKPEKKPERIGLQRARALEALAEPMTACQLGAKLFVTHSRARFYIRELRLAKQAYICGWEPAAGQGDIAPIYALGSKRDKKKPLQTRAQRYKQEMKDPERRDRITMLRKKRENLARVLRQPTHWASALEAP